MVYLGFYSLSQPDGKENLAGKFSKYLLTTVHNAL